MQGSEQRSGEDRRHDQISHRTLYEKQLHHDKDIHAIKSDVHELRKEVHVISTDLKPISRGITSMVFLFKLFLALGALAAAGVGVMEFWEHFHHVSDHVHGG